MLRHLSGDIYVPVPFVRVKFVPVDICLGRQIYYRCLGLFGLCHHPRMVTVIRLSEAPNSTVDTQTNAYLDKCLSQQMSTRTNLIRTNYNVHSAMCIVQVQ